LFKNLNSVIPAGIVSGASNVKSAPVTLTTRALAAGAGAMLLTNGADAGDATWLFAPRVAAVIDTAMSPTTVTDATNSSSLDRLFALSRPFCGPLQILSTEIEKKREPDGFPFELIVRSIDLRV
jgi:hypothetical protein